MFSNSRQYYTYVTDPNCKRVGTQCWVYGAIMVTESMLCIKNGKELFGQAQVCNVIVWLVIQILVSIGCVYGVVLYHRYIEVCSTFFCKFCNMGCYEYSYPHPYMPNIRINLDTCGLDECGRH